MALTANFAWTLAISITHAGCVRLSQTPNPVITNVQVIFSSITLAKAVLFSRQLLNVTMPARAFCLKIIPVKDVKIKKELLIASCASKMILSSITRLTNASLAPLPAGYSSAHYVLAIYFWLLQPSAFPVRIL